MMNKEEVIKQLEEFMDDKELSAEERDGWEQVRRDLLDDENHDKT